MNTMPASRAADRALVIGEALIDVVQRPDGSQSSHPGGSPANVALGLGRLGRTVDLLTWIGADAAGDEIRAHLASSGVGIIGGDGGPITTPRATARLAVDGSADYDFHLAWDLPTPRSQHGGPPLVVHTGSIAAVLEPGGTKVLTEIERRHATSTVTYDPNLRPALMGSRRSAAARVNAFVQVADVVKVSDEDLAWLHPGAEPHEIAHEWLQNGPSLVVITRGGRGATGITATAQIHVPAPRVDVVDTVGAGDSFMAGLIDGLWASGLLGRGQRHALGGADATTLTQVLTRSAHIAAVTVSRAGANPPRASELPQRDAVG